MSLESKAKTTREIIRLQKDHYKEDEMGRDYIDSTTYDDGKDGEAKWILLEDEEKVVKQQIKFHHETLAKLALAHNLLNKIMKSRVFNTGMSLDVVIDDLNHLKEMLK